MELTIETLLTIIAVILGFMALPSIIGLIIFLVTLVVTSVVIVLGAFIGAITGGSKWKNKK